MHVNRYADFPLRLDLRLPEHDDTTQDQEPLPDLTGIGNVMSGINPGLEVSLPSYANDRYNYPCTVFTLRHTEEDAPRVKAWFSGDYSEVTNPPSAGLGSNLSRALDSILNGYYLAAARNGCFTSPCRIGAAVLLTDGRRIPFGNMYTVHRDTVGPQVGVRSYTPSSTMMSAYVEIRNVPVRVGFCLMPHQAEELERLLGGLEPLEIQFYATQQARLSPDPLTCTGLRAMTFGTGDDSERMRGFVYDAYEKEYVAARLEADTTFRIIGSIRWTGGEVTKPVSVVNYQDALSNWQECPLFTTAPETEPEPEEPESEAPALVRWEAEVFTTDLRRAFRASMDADGTLTNAVRNPDGSFRLTVHGHGLECGPVRCRVTPWLPDKDFPLGARREPIMLATDIILWDGNTDAPELTAEVTAALPLFQGPQGPRGRDAAAQNPTRVIATHRARKGDPATNRNRYLCRVVEGSRGDSVVRVQEHLNDEDAMTTYAEVIIAGPGGWNGNPYIAVWWDGERWRGANLSINDIPDRLPPPTEDEVIDYIINFAQRHPEGNSPVSSFRFQFQTRVRVRTQNGNKRWRWSRKVRLDPRMNKFVFRVRRIRLRAGSHDRPRHRNKIASEWVVFGKGSGYWKKL